MNTFNPLVSIVIPIYNGQDFLHDAISSALKQRYKNIEVIVINDGSTDSSEKMAKNFGDKILYFKKKNEGVATALNLGIKKAKGKYISWLSHDDVYLPSKVEEQIKALNLLPLDLRQKTICYSDYMFTDRKGNMLQEVKLRQIFKQNQLDDPLFPLFKQVIHGCSLLIPKKCFDEIEGFDENLKHTQDYNLWFMMFPKYKLIHIPQILIKSRLHDLQSSKSSIDAIVEGDELWTKMYKGITDKQKEFIGGTLDEFYVSSFRHMLLAKHYRAAQYLTHCVKNKPSVTKTMGLELKSHLQTEQDGREFAVVKSSKFFKLWKMFCNLKDKIRTLLQ